MKIAKGCIFYYYAYCTTNASSQNKECFSPFRISVFIWKSRNALFKTVKIADKDFLNWVTYLGSTKVWKVPTCMKIAM